MFWVATYEAGKIGLQKLWSSTGYSSGTVTVKDGVLSVHYDECPDAYAVDYRRNGAKMVADPVRKRRVRSPDQCAACPLVFTLQSSGFWYQGEILRNLRRRSLEGTQSLELLAPHKLRGPGADQLTIELREVKDEVSFVDAVWLEVDGRRLEPADCLDASDLHCADDGAELVMQRGDRRRFAFTTGELTASSRVRVWADGYYVPLTTR